MHEKEKKKGLCFLGVDHGETEEQWAPEPTQSTTNHFQLTHWLATCAGHGALMDSSVSSITAGQAQLALMFSRNIITHHQLQTINHYGSFYHYFAIGHSLTGNTMDPMDHTGRASIQPIGTDRTGIPIVKQ